MSRFFSNKYRSLVPYTPGEQPTERKYIKLNTNESPFPPSDKAVAAAAEAARLLQLYPDPTCGELTAAVATLCGVQADEVLLTNGSDEILNFAFMAFCDDEHPAVFPDISYGFYKVFAELNGVPYRTVPLKDDLSIDPADYAAAGGTVFIANPNAPTGLALSPAEVEGILQANPNNVVVIDEAYVDFGAESCVSLVHKYDNLLVTQTFSKSRSMAGARLGFGVGCAALIQDLNTVKYSTNPYNINRMTMAAGLGVLADEAYTQANCRAVCATRTQTREALLQLGFEVAESKTNFLFARHRGFGGAELYAKLKENGILVRHFNQPRIQDYIRITIGSSQEMQVFVNTLRTILEEC
ncbi:MAG: histidinol-phosphate transaminase [Clostridia bacterium]|nr:histidinol-phosphate transaminase [Clostridia bacterium]